MRQFEESGCSVRRRLHETRRSMEAWRSIEYFNSRLWNKNDNRDFIKDIGDIIYGLVTQYNNSVVDTGFSKYLLGKTTSKEKDQLNY